MIINYNNNSFNINNNINQTVNFYAQNAVRDEVRGFLVYNNSLWSFVGCYQIPSQGNKERIALVLESPHKDEFDINGNPLRPANGRTGVKINKKLQDRNFVRALKHEVIYEVRIVNSIQYQASCYSVLGSNYSRKNTNQVFRVLFNKSKGNLRQDFIDRIDNYNPNIVVNCCTSGLKEVVETALKETKNYNPSTTFTDKHPIAW